MSHIAVTKDGAEWACPEPYLARAIEKGWTPVNSEDLPAGLKPPFNPGDYDVDAVNKHLADHAGDQSEVDRVLAAEASGKARKGVTAPGQPG